MKKLYAGIAATALAATGIACTAGAVHADVAPWSSLDYAPSANGDMISTAVGADGTVYTASLNDARDRINVSTTTPTGASTHHTVAPTPADGMSIDDIGSVAVTSTGKLVISAAQIGDVYDAGVWTARVGDDAATETISGLDGTGPVAVSSDGNHAALATYSTMYSFAPSDTTATSVAFDESEDAYANVTALAVADSGKAYAVGEDATNAPMGWEATAGDPTASPLRLAAAPVSVAFAGSTVVIGEKQETDDDVTYSLEVVAATSEPHAVPLPDQPDLLAVSPNGGTLFASDGYDVERVDLTQLDTDTGAGQVPAQQFDDEIFGLTATSATFYAVTSAYDGDTDSYETASLLRLTKPGAVRNATQSVYADGSIDLEWKAPADTGGVDPAYVVTLTDKAGKVLTDRVTDTYDYLDSRKGLRPGSTYTITVRAENVAFSGQDVPVAPVLPGASTVTVSGSAVVGGTLTANVANKWPAGTKVSYQWGYSGGQYGGAVDGATSRTFAPTADLAGLQVTVRVTGTLAGYSPTTVTSAPVVIKPAPTHTAPKPAPKPEKVAKIKPATIKAGAKKVKVNLPGITVTKAPGKVKVYDGKKLIGTATIKNGKLVLKLKKKLPKGKHKIKVKYAGSAQVAKFTKTVKVTVK
jgi:hypothetical protein